MKRDFDKLPKTIKKTIRFIWQDATLDQLKQIRALVNATIELKEEKLK